MFYDSLLSQHTLEETWLMLGLWARGDCAGGVRHLVVIFASNLTTFLKQTKVLVVYRKSKGILIIHSFIVVYFRVPIP